jgi:hypothetical protein
MEVKPPAHLSARGKELWAAVTGDDRYGWSAGRLTVLQTALELLDRLDDIRTELKGKKLTTKTTGGPAAHPLLKIEQSIRDQFLSTWVGLDLRRHPNPAFLLRAAPTPPP